MSGKIACDVPRKINAETAAARRGKVEPLFRRNVPDEVRLATYRL